MSPRLRTHLAIAAIAAAAATASVGLLSRPADAGDGYIDLRADNARLRSDLSYYQSAYKELTGGLDRIETANLRNRDRRAREAIEDLIDETRDRTSHYVEDNRPGNGPGPGPVDQPRCGRDDDARFKPPMAPDDFQRLAAQLRNAYNPNEGVEILRAAAPYNYFTVDQVVTLLKASPFEQARVEMAVLLYPRTSDVQRWFLVYGAFDFPSSKEGLRKRLAAGQPAPTVAEDPRCPRAPLGQDDYQKLVTLVRAGNYPSEGIEIVRAAVAGGSNFTVDQVAAVLKASPFEQARVEMALALYPRTLDRERWFVVYASFDLPSSKEAVRRRLAP